MSAKHTKHTNDDFIHRLEIQKFELEAHNRELREATRLLDESRLRYQELFDQAPLGYLTLDTQGRILDCNQMAGLFLKQSPAQLKGRFLEQWIPDEDRKILASHLMTSLSSAADQPLTTELRLLPEGARSASLFQLHTRLVTQSSSQQKLFRTALLDLTDRTRANDAEAASRSKSVFLANMSHEIRTPIGAILGFVELLRNPSLPPAKRDHCIEVIKRNGTTLSRLIDDLLDLSNAEADRIGIERMEFSLQTLLSEIQEGMRLRAREKGLEFKMEGQNLPPTIASDPTRIRQILLSIIGNAIKFTDRGSIAVTVTSRPLQAQTQLLIFTVQDTGRGILPCQRARLFQNFSQADSSVTRKFGGTGLGLALSRKLAQALGGNVVLDETSTHPGSTFVVTLEVGRVTQASPLNVLPAQFADQEAERLQRLSGLRVLVVEDSPDNQLLIQHFMNQWGAQVEFADNGRQGVHTALSRHYDLILMDVQMPVMDGHTATRELRKCGYRKPIIALSAHALKEDRELSLRAGCDSHLTKPINPQQLAETVQKFARPTVH